jgi:hypothetical protein
MYPDSSKTSSANVDDFITMDSSAVMIDVGENFIGQES